MVLAISLLLFLPWEAWESCSETEVLVDVFVGKFVEFVLVALHLRDEIGVVLWLCELTKVFSVNHISKFVFHLDD